MGREQFDVQQPDSTSFSKIRGWSPEKRGIHQQRRTQRLGHYKYSYYDKICT